MLKKIPKILSPETVKILMEMGHGDEIVLADANFPAETLGSRVIRADGIEMPKILDAILELFPLDHYSDYQVSLMQVVPGDNVVPEIWEVYKEIIKKYDQNILIKEIERFDFYKKSKNAYAILITGETALYGNIILKKGVI